MRLRSSEAADCRTLESRTGARSSTTKQGTLLDASCCYDRAPLIGAEPKRSRCVSIAVIPPSVKISAPVT